MFALKEISMFVWIILILASGVDKLMISSASAISVEKAMEQASVYGCSSDAECASNHYCGGKMSRRCIECFDCSKLQRRPKRGYDGASLCATSSPECGLCNPGFEEHSGHCFPRSVIERENREKITDFVKYNAAYEPSLKQSSKPQIVTIENNEVSSSLGWIFSLVGIGVVIAIIIIIPIIIRCNILNILKKNGSASTRSFEEEDGTELASAPPAEYQQQLPFIPSSLYNYRPTTTHNRMQQAIPYNAGNGAGNWVSDVENDAIDGIEENESSIIESPPIVVQTNEISTSAIVNGNGVMTGQQGSGLAQGNSQTLQHSGNGNYGPNLSHGNSNSGNSSVNGASSGEPITTHDSVLGYVRFHAFGLIQGSGTILRSNTSPAGADGGATEAAGSRFVVTRSAPTSPRSIGRIDDTYCESLLSLSGSFDQSASNTSIDSGTGVSESFQVPSRPDSRSAFQGMSDADDYDEEMFPESPLATQPVESSQPLMAPPPLQMDNMDLD